MKSSLNQKIELPILKEKGIELFIKREDLLHPTISGNKYRKLKYNLQQAKLEGKKRLLTFGGAYSNHILATAAAGKENGFKTIGIIRGEELGENVEKTLTQNLTLKQSASLGMEFLFISRSDYQQKNEKWYVDLLLKKYPDAYLIPEGGTNKLAIKGCEEILTKQDTQFTHITCAMGTGGTVTGVINSSKYHQQLLVFPALKGSWIESEIKSLKPNKNNWNVVRGYQGKGYGKVTEELISFVNAFKKQTNIPLDPIYTGKMMLGLMDLIQKDYFSKESKILAIHTGGLQGITGINQQLKQKNKPILL